MKTFGIIVKNMYTLFFSKYGQYIFKKSKKV